MFPHGMTSHATHTHTRLHQRPHPLTCPGCICEAGTASDIQHDTKPQPLSLILTERAIAGTRRGWGLGVTGRRGPIAPLAQDHAGSCSQPRIQCHAPSAKSIGLTLANASGLRFGVCVSWCTPAREGVVTRLGARAPAPACRSPEYRPRIISFQVSFCKLVYIWIDSGGETVSRVQRHSAQRSGKGREGKRLDARTMCVLPPLCCPDSARISCPASPSACLNSNCSSSPPLHLNYGFGDDFPNRSRMSPERRALGSLAGT